ncbi:hypothetical protein AB0M75_06540 [Streptomyces anulatus]|uniref:hypothetical protein n=1 Tax=Streptomyces anulatus TaxID=1892 RepID=UPI0034478E4B
MISARLRYIALSLLAVGLFTGGLLWALEGVWIGAVMSLWLTCLCLLGRTRIRHTVGHHQAEQAHELQQLTPQTWLEPWADWCCERGFITRGDLHHPTRCTTVVSP